MSLPAAAWARGRRAAAACALACVLIGVTACSGAQADPVPTRPSTSGVASPSPASGVDKVLVIVEENRSLEDVTAHMPFLVSQVSAYGAGTQFYAIEHPSLPNYLVLAGGSTFGVTNDKDPDVHSLDGPSLFGELLAAGRTAKTYAEAMPGNCAQRNQDTY